MEEVLSPSDARFRVWIALTEMQIQVNLSEVAEKAVIHPVSERVTQDSVRALLADKVKAEEVDGIISNISELERRAKPKCSIEHRERIAAFRRD